MVWDRLAAALAIVAALAPPATGPVLPRLAVLPVDDATGFAAPIEDVQRLLEDVLRAEGFEVASPEALQGFLARKRIRYTGGLAVDTLRALREELGVDAAVLTSIDQLVEEPPPRLALTARAVRALDGAVVWAGESALCGEERPGILGMGEVFDPGVLVDRAVASTARSLRDAFSRLSVAGPSARPAWDHPRPRDTFRPGRVYRSDDLSAPRGHPPLVAVLPFDSLAPVPRAGDTVASLFAVHLAGRDALTVVEPGEVREALLKNRIVQVSGLSLAQAEALRVHLGVDLIVTGRVLTFDDRGPGSTPRVEFSARVIDAERREILWSCLSAHEGDDGVNLFGTRRLLSARALASAMVRAAAEGLVEACAAPPREHHP